MPMTRLLTTAITMSMAVGAALAALCATSSAQTSGEPIKFGAVLSITGAGAGLGNNERNGLTVAEKTINAAGGYKGRPIKIVIEDDTSNPDVAVSKVNDLIYNEKVIAVSAARCSVRQWRSAALRIPQKSPSSPSRALARRSKRTASAWSTCCRRTK
jgi:branched-chain amino acid transport system substrate-binding protein